MVNQHLDALVTRRTLLLDALRLLNRYLELVVHINNPFLPELLEDLIPLLDQ